MTWKITDSEGEVVDKVWRSGFTVQQKCTTRSGVMTSDLVDRRLQVGYLLPHEARDVTVVDDGIQNTLQARHVFCAHR